MRHLPQVQTLRACLDPQTICWCNIWKHQKECKKKKKEKKNCDEQNINISHKERDIDAFSSGLGPSLGASRELAGGGAQGGIGIRGMDWSGGIGHLGELRAGEQVVAAPICQQVPEAGRGCSGLGMGIE